MNAHLKVLPTIFPEVKLIEPTVFHDARGFFFESFNERVFNEALRVAYAQSPHTAAFEFPVRFVQDNQSRSNKNVVRGLHYQLHNPQGKLVRVLRGEIFDVVVDLRRSSANFGRALGHYLSAENHRQLWIPPGFAHGFLACSDQVECAYKTTQYYEPAHTRCIRWDDPDLKIAWPLDGAPIEVSSGEAASTFIEAEVFN